MKHYYLIVDCETTKKQTVADFGAVIVTKQGEIVEQVGHLVNGHFGKFPLFSDPLADPEAFWSEQSAQRRLKDYDQMVEDGHRSIASVGLINQWLVRVNAQYSPVLTAYNISFDFGKCRNTRINLGIFAERFCLLKAAKRKIGVLAEYQQFCQDRGFLTAKLRNPSMTADTMAKFILGDSLEDEPHTSLEDARDYEAPILTHILRDTTRAQLLELGK